MMRLQVLLATMNQKDDTILEKMNIQSDVIIGNQCDYNEVKQTSYKGHVVKWYSFNERGVGVNRNNILLRADAEIVVFADDDVVYVDNYANIIVQFFEKHNDADVVIFNVREKRGDNELKELVSKTERIHRNKATRYGTYAVAAKVNSIRSANIFFHTQFGGGAVYSCGEDTIFLQDCFKKGLHIYTCKELIATVIQGSSTWFHGYNEKYFMDKGVLFKHLYPCAYKEIALYNALKHRDLYKEIGWKKAFYLMCQAKEIDQR